MKRKYIRPASTRLALCTESMIAVSQQFVIGGDGAPTIDSEEEAWANKKGGWNSETWNNE